MFDKHKIKSIFFDLDGTLLKSGPDLMTAVNHVLMLNNMKPIEDDKVIGSLVGGGAAMMIDRAFMHYNEKINKSLMPE